jgi:hypothetical protein
MAIDELTLKVAAFAVFVALLAASQVKRRGRDGAADNGTVERQAWATGTPTLIVAAACVLCSVVLDAVVAYEALVGTTVGARVLAALVAHLNEGRASLERATASDALFLVWCFVAVLAWIGVWLALRVRRAGHHTVFATVVVVVGIAAIATTPGFICLVAWAWSWWRAEGERRCHDLLASSWATQRGALKVAASCVAMAVAGDVYVVPIALEPGARLLVHAPTRAEPGDQVELALSWSSLPRHALVQAALPPWLVDVRADPPLVYDETTRTLSLTVAGPDTPRAHVSATIHATAPVGTIFAIPATARAKDLSVSSRPARWPDSTCAARVGVGVEPSTRWCVATKVARSWLVLWVMSIVSGAVAWIGVWLALRVVRRGPRSDRVAAIVTMIVGIVAGFASLIVPLITLIVLVWFLWMLRNWRGPW